MILNFIKIYLLIILVIGINGCATTPTHTGLPVGVPLQDICSHYNIQWQLDHVTQTIVLNYKDHQAKALVGSAIVLIGEQKITLNAPIRQYKSTIYVPDDFELKVIGTFGAPRTILGSTVDKSNLRIRTIMIDPGHGGKDPGAKGVAGVKEKEVVLDVSRRLKSLLEDAGIKVVMTRQSDNYPSLEQRTELASNNDIDFFISIHANSMPNRKSQSRKIQGIEVYYVQSQTKKDLDEQQRRDNEKSFVNSLKVTPQKNAQAIVADMMYQLKVAESGKLAKHIVHDLSGDLKTPNRGARHCRYFVVRNTVQPAVLIETGFLTNKHEERKLNSSEYRQRIAESIARSILNYASN